MGSASRQGVSHKARLAVKGESLCKRRNTVDDALPTRPQGACQIRPCRVAVLDNGTTIVCVRRLAWTHLAGSEPIKTTLLEYWYGTGDCYAKSHLLAALLRANGIPAGLCYQRLTIDNNIPPFCLHGLSAVLLEKHGWYRIDPRGNKAGVNADFCPPQEKLAFPVTHEGEMDIPEIYAEPLASVVDTLESYSSYIDVSNNLPDIEPIA